jgi:hypothetical protein
MATAATRHHLNLMEYAAQLLILKYMMPIPSSYFLSKANHHEIEQTGPFGTVFCYTHHA